jgi:alpha/beta superfamily hydrolase
MSREEVYFYAESLEPIRLEGILELPEERTRPPACILCHPHPIGGGSMSVPLLEIMSEVLAESGWACLRFNFRGVGRSGGVSTGGIREVEDIEGAWTWLREREDIDADDLSVAGWSFGEGRTLPQGGTGEPALGGVRLLHLSGGG